MEAKTNERSTIDYDKKNIKSVELFESLDLLVGETLILKEKNRDGKGEDKILIGSMSVERGECGMLVEGIICIADTDGKIVFKGINYQFLKNYRVTLAPSNFDNIDVYYLDANSIFPYIKSLLPQNEALQE